VDQEKKLARAAKDQASRREAKRARRRQMREGDLYSPKKKKKLRGQREESGRRNCNHPCAVVEKKVVCDGYGNHSFLEIWPGARKKKRHSPTSTDCEFQKKALNEKGEEYPR